MRGLDLAARAALVVAGISLLLMFVRFVVVPIGNAYAAYEAYASGIAAE